jgi:HEAT repeat protein
MFWPGVLLAFSIAMGGAPPVLAGSAKTGPLLHILEAGQIAERKEAIAQLVDIGAAAVPSLVAVLDSASAQLRGDATYALARIGDPESLAGFRQQFIKILAHDGAWRVRANTAYILGAISDQPGVLAALMACMSDAEAKVRFACSVNLSRAARVSKRAVEVVPVFTRALSDTDRTVRFEAAAGLSAIGAGDAHTVEVLKARLNVETDPWVKSALLDALGAAGPAALPALPDLIAALAGPDPQIVAKRAARAIARLGAPAVPALIAALNYPADQAG